VDKLCAMQATREEIINFIGISEDTMERACKREHKCNFAVYFAQKRTPGRISLRRKQWQKAVEDGDIAMLIFLGKQYLDQSDRRREEVSGPGGTPERIIVEYVNAPPENTEPAHSADES
jgi:hypothetical protein